ncbi:MAG TPA: hypothetical protein VFS44_11965 [Gemmatimonadaceae bacterium]|nr:hypothetical protein [Gemmatimonadaceae bacterium]
MILERVIPILAAAQWIVGLLVATVAVGRSRRFGRSGVAPRLLARVGIVIFVVAAVLVLLAATPVGHVVAGLLPPEPTGARWRTTAFLKWSLLAWGLVAVSSFWNWTLGVALRRRTAAAELGRRTARVMAHRREESPPPPRGRASRED